MQKLVKEYLNEWKSRQKKRRRTVIAVMILVVMVVGMVGSVLTQYGIAMTGNAKCGIEEHQHTEACYGESLICDLAEDAGHTHTEACYTEIQELTCGQEESEEHQHTEDCYTESQELICGQEENTGHIHDASCYEEQITCPMEEHVHTEECYIDKEADIESAGDWEKTFSGINLTDDWAENVAGIAETQEGYLASEDNYELAEDGTTQRRYTRYGQWYGNPYGDEEGHWDTMFAAFCLDYAGVKNVPYGKNIGEWIKKLNETDTENIKRNSEASRLFQGIGYEAAVGDVVFFDDDKDNGLDRCGILTEIVPQTEENDGCYQVVEVKDDRSVVKQEYELDDNRIASWLQIPENPDAAVVSDDMNPEEPDKPLMDEELQIEEEPQEDELQENEPQEEKIRKEEIIASVPIKDKDGNPSGNINLELLYGDTKGYDEHPNGTSYYTNQTMTGYIRLYAADVSGDIELGDMVITMYFPKKYLQKDKITVSEVNQNLGNFIIDGVEEEGEYYKVKIDIKDFTQTANLRFPFKMQFKSGEVPKNYELKIYAELEYDMEKDETAKYTYLPKYDAPYITKYANTNVYASMANDGTYISARISEDGVLYDEDYASFWFTLGGDVLKSFRSYGKITLTDTLPTYENADGEIKTATLHKSCSNRWTDNGNGTVSYTVELPENFDGSPAQADAWLAEKIKEVELRLCFPECKMEEKDPESSIWEKELTNNIKAECTPWNALEGEKEDVCEDDIDFILTSQPRGDGEFAKYNSQNIIVDREDMRSSLYKWGMRFENTNSTIPLEKIVFSDNELDERLKFREIEMVTEDWKEKLDYVQVKGEGSVSEKYEIKDFKDNKLILPQDNIYTGFEIYLKESYKMKLGDSFHIMMRSTFREPKNNHFDENNPSKNRYVNKANVRFYHENSSTLVTLFSQNEFKLTKLHEEVWIEKSKHYGPDVYEAGESVSWRIQIHGSGNGGGLAEDKEYDDLCVIDLLPEGFDYEWEKMEVAYGAYECIEGAAITDDNGNIERNPNYRPEVIENYKGTGRTALIFKINAEKAREEIIKQHWKHVDFYIYLKIPETILPGDYTNEVYLVSKDLDEPVIRDKKEDQYDMDGDGQTDDKFSYSKSQITIKTNDSICSQKYIAEGDLNNWKTSALLLTEGDEFRYKLKVKPVEGEDEDLVVYDVLPKKGDKNILGNDRKSEFTVQLRDFINAPDGYKVFYTDSAQVYMYNMDDVLKNEQIMWKERSEVLDLSSITAFKIEGEDNTTLEPNKDVDIIVPTKVIDEISDKDSLLLGLEESGKNGIAQFLESVNSFGYRTKNTLNSDNGGTGIKESNYVRVKIPFLSLSIKKIGNDMEDVLSGAEFMLEKDGKVISEKISEKDGKIVFKELEEGTYILTETKPPKGYTLPRVNTWTIQISCDLDKNEYKAEIVGNENVGSGTQSDPFIITNTPTYELPSTGGSGIYWYMFSGMLLMSAAAGITYRNKRKGVLGS